MFREIKNFNLKYIFSGNPAGGTSFTASYLTYCGFVCTHEGILVINDKLVTNKEQTEIAQGESSYIASSWYDKPHLDKLPIIIIVRNPIDILNSLIAKNVDHGSTIDINKIIDDILNRYKILESNPRTVFKFRIEHDLEKLCEFLNLPYLEPKEIYSRTHNLGRVNMKLSDLKMYDRFEALKNFAEKYQYITE